MVGSLLFASFWIAVGIAIGYILGTVLAFSFWHKEIERMSARRQRYGGGAT